MGAKYFGAAVLRREDPRFLRGEGRFVDDVTLPGLLQAAFLRSPHAHARIVAIRTERAKKMPGVVAVFTHADLARWMKAAAALRRPAARPRRRREVRHPPGPAVRARHAARAPRRRDRGDGVATTAAAPRTPSRRSRCSGHRCARGGHAHRRRGRRRLVHPDWGTNVAVGFSHAIGDAGRALAGADVVLEETFRIQRYVGMPLEGRGVVAAWDRRDGTLTTWNSTQVSHFVQQGLVTALELLPHASA